MKTYTNLRTIYGKITKNSTSDNLTLGDELMNDEHRKLCALKDFSFLRRARTMTTTASTQFKALPYDVERVESISVVVGTTTCVPRPVHSREEWDMLNQTTYTSDFPERYFVYNGQLGLWPTPQTSNNVITVNGKIRPVDLNVADITSTTIATLANGSTALTVSAELTAQMVGFWIRPTFSTTANTGDGQWYEISNVTNATTATLVRAYGGNSITAGAAACVIGQMPLLPEAFHQTIILPAAALYWELQGDLKRSTSYLNRYTNDVKTLTTQYTSFISDPVLQESASGGEDIINPNLTISL